MEPISAAPPDVLDEFLRKHPYLAEQARRDPDYDPARAALCLYEGPVTEPCKTCNAGARDVRVCAHPSPSDPDRDVCTRARVSDRVQACATCQDRRTIYDPPSFLARYDRENLAPHLDAAHRHRFNASLLRWGSGFLLAYRTGWAGSEIYVTRFDSDLRPVPCATVHLPLRRAGADYGREDPRLFVYRDQPHVAFAGVEGGGQWVSHTNVLYARLHPETLAVEETFYPRYALRTKWEKNWACFQAGDSLYAVYQIHPRHQILRICGEEARLCCDEPNPMPWSGGVPRGGASPLRRGDEFWHFFHDRITVGGPLVYRTSLYTFEIRPPFRPLRYTPRPLLTADRRTKPADQYCACVFPGGAVVRDGRVVVSHGIHDRWTEFHQWSLADLEARLRPIGG